MAYINFKEEKAVANDQLVKRRENNNKLFEKIKNTKILPKKYKADKELSYKKFKNNIYGINGIHSEDEFQVIENKDIICTEFIKCEFNNITFNNCKFIGCIFKGCSFSLGGVAFNDCTFIMEEKYEKPSLNKYDNFSCEFLECDIYAKFNLSNLSHCIFKDCALGNIGFEDSNMTSVLIKNCECSGFSFKDCNLSGIKVFESYIEDLDFKDEDKSKLDEKSFFDKIELKKYTRDEYEGVYTVYEDLADKFKENNLINNFGEYYYLCKKTQRKALKFIPKIGSYIYYIICGYGERPWNAFFSAMLMFVIFAFIYLGTGFSVGGEYIQYPNNEEEFSVREFASDYHEAFNVSILVFSGVGEDVELTKTSYFVENIEAIFGVIIIGNGLATLTRKVIR